MAYDGLTLRFIHLKNQMMQLFLQMPKIRCRGVSCDIKSQ